jgi:acetate kinase
MPAPVAIGHRIVQGGPKRRQYCLIDDALLRDLEAASARAPLHTPAALAVIRFAQQHFPGLPQAACFDAAFSAELSEARASSRFPRNCNRRESNATGFTAYRANRSCDRLRPNCRTA